MKDELKSGSQKTEFRSQKEDQRTFYSDFWILFSGFSFIVPRSCFIPLL